MSQGAHGQDSSHHGKNVSLPQGSAKSKRRGCITTGPLSQRAVADPHRAWARGSAPDVPCPGPALPGTERVLHSTPGAQY